MVERQRAAMTDLLQHEAGADLRDAGQRNQFLGGEVRISFHVDGNHIEKVVVVVVFLSLLPPIYEYIKARREKARARAEAGDVSV